MEEKFVNYLYKGVHQAKIEELKEQVISLQRIGEPAPAFDAVINHGVL